MVNFNIDFARLIRESIPKFLHLPRRLNFLTCLAKPFKIIWADFVAMKDDMVYRAVINPSIISLEMALNDKFDPVNRDIYISDAFYPKVFIYRKSELKQGPILYRKWNAVTDFVTGKFCFYDGLIYESTATPNVNKTPGVDPEWVLAPGKKAPVLRMKPNYSGQIAFIVNVPNTLVYSQFEMHKLIKTNKVAGPGYIIKTF